MTAHRSPWRHRALALAVSALLLPGLGAGLALAQEAPKAEEKPAPRPQLDVIFVPTPQPAVERMLDLARVGPRDFVIDLGSGDGRIAITAGRRGARALGVDLDPQRLAEAAKNLEAAGVGDRVEFRQQNLFETDLSKATVITMYLLPSLNLKLRPQLLDLKPGTRIASHDFTMGDWKPDVFENVQGRDVLFWVIPAKVDGTWQVRTRRDEFTVTIEQKFQEISGTVQIGNRRVPLRGAQIHGDRIEFSADLAGRLVHFRGRVDGNEIKGRMRGAQRAGRNWTAQRK